MIQRAAIEVDEVGFDVHARAVMPTIFQSLFEPQVPQWVFVKV